MMKHLQPEMGAVFWDEGLPQKRIALQPAYKETRKEMPQPMIPQLDFIQNLQYKYIELVTLDLEGSTDENVKESVTFRYNMLKAKLGFLQSKFKQFSSVVKTKSPSLMMQMQKAFKAGEKGLGTSHPPKPWKQG